MVIILRVGIGYDVHKLVDSRKLMLGGVHIPFEKGLLGHSDADVLIHSIMDSLLGALAKGDIGKHFPDTDSNYKNANSMELLVEINNIVKSEGYSIVNIDSVIVAQKPKLTPYIEDMVKNIASNLNISENQVNVKATTEEGLGFTGSGDGISAKAVVLIEKSKTTD